MRVTCIDEACTATAVASARTPRVRARKARTYKLKPSRAAIATGETVTIRLAVPVTARTAIRRALNARRRVVVTVKVTVRDVRGNTTTLTRHVRLKRFFRRPR